MNFDHKISSLFVAFVFSTLSTVAQASECREIRFCDGDENCPVAGYVKSVRDTVIQPLLEHRRLLSDAFICQYEGSQLHERNSLTRHTCVRHESLCDQGAHYVLNTIGGGDRLHCEGGWELVSESEKLFWPNGSGGLAEALVDCQNFSPHVLRPSNARLE